jgi:hypothetical protein
MFHRPHPATLKHLIYLHALILLLSSSCLNRANFQGPPIQGDVTKQANGDLFVKAGTQAKGNQDGRNFHYWYNDWPPYYMNSSDVGGVFVRQRMWLVPDDPSQPYNLSNARYLASVGGTVLADYNTIGYLRVDSDLPRMKYVTAKPRFFYYMSYQALDRIQQYPPPEPVLRPCFNNIFGCSPPPPNPPAPPPPPALGVYVTCGSYS